MSQRLFKFCFQAKISTLSLNLNFPCDISIVWKRGDKLAETKQRKPVIKGLVEFNETIAIDCNMAINQSTKKFDPKKTVLTVLIFTQKGCKQAGEIELDVSGPLNERKDEKEFELGLNKCPDKQAKLKFKLSCFFKQEIKMDNISQSSYKTVNVVEMAGKINLPDFKKKGQVEEESKEPQVENWNQTHNLTSSQSHSLKAIKSETGIKQNIQDMRAKNLEDQNRKLKQDQKELKAEQQQLMLEYQQKLLGAKEQKAKSLECKKELERLYRQERETIEMQKTRKELFDKILDCRQKLALIFNAAFQIGGPKLADYLQEASGYVQNGSNPD